MQTRLTADEARQLAVEYYDTKLDTVLDVIKHKAQQGHTKATFGDYLGNDVIRSLQDLGYVTYNQDSNVEVLW